MPTTAKRKFVDYEQNSRWAKTALQACSLHDRLMDCIKIYNGLDVDVGCRAALEVDVRPGIRLLAKDFKDRPGELNVVETIEIFIKRQGLDPENLIHLEVLQRMQDMYIQFVTNDSFEVAATDSYGNDNDTQLMIRSLQALPRSTRLSLSGISFTSFPLPDSEEMPHDLERHFSDESTFVTPAGIRHIQLGPATLLNHHCEADKRNVEPFGKPNSSKSLKGIATLHQPILTRAIAAGEELLSDYGDAFFDGIENVCSCFSKMHYSSKIRLRTKSSRATVSDIPSRVSRKRKRGSDKTLSHQAHPQASAGPSQMFDEVSDAEPSGFAFEGSQSPDYEIPEPSFQLGLEAIREERARSQRSSVSAGASIWRVKGDGAAHVRATKPEKSSGLELQTPGFRYRSVSSSGTMTTPVLTRSLSSYSPNELCEAVTPTRSTVRLGIQTPLLPSDCDEEDKWLYGDSPSVRSEAPSPILDAKEEPMDICTSDDE